MILLLAGLGILVLSGLLTLLAPRSPRAATAIGAGGAVAGCALGLIPAAGGMYEAFSFPWNVPFGSFSVELDPLSAFFLIPIFGLSGLAAIYGAEYLYAYRDRKSLGPPWFFFNLLVASMALVVIARNAVLFLTAWEVMTLASFFLVTFEHEKESVREAGWTYLVASHLGTAFLLVLFILHGRAHPGVIFLLAVVGFGTKAGFMPLHVWLPEAHPAAPTHVSAVMSGVMIKTGIYGLLRVLIELGPPPAWFGWVFVGIGATSGILGVLFALAQHDIKRLLAYHSVENIGIIALGLGVGLLGLAHHAPAVAALGFAGGLLHVLNHALFKGLLFLGAGSVLHATGTREMDRLGGLLKRMRVTGATFLIGAVAISGLPPLNGFVSEFLIFLGAFRSGTWLGVPIAAPALAAIGGLALIGGLAAACFTKAFGIVFLGEPRTDPAARAHEPGMAMRLPMILLAAACVLVGLGAPAWIALLSPVVDQVGGLSSRSDLQQASIPLSRLVLAAAGFLGLVAVLALLRRALLRGRSVTESSTWGCGYLRPSARMQYTSSSFADPLTRLFQFFLRTRERRTPVEGYFPGHASLSTETPDVCEEGLYRPLFGGIGRALSKLRWLQHGRVHLYVLYIAVTLLLLLVWKLG